MGITATYGGLNLMLCPDGSRLGLPLYLLANTPFSNYFFPSLILLVSNGFSGLFIAWLSITESRYSCWLVKVQGLVLIGYIGIQVLMIDVTVPLRIICGGAGLLMILLGFLYEELLTGRHKNNHMKQI